MRVFFTTPYAGKSRYQPYIDHILLVLRERKAVVVTPEDRKQYNGALKHIEPQVGDHNQAHYRFITQGIAGADIVIIEASYEDFRVGHEVTLALMFNKPTFVLSQHHNYAQYIPHELLHGAKYGNKAELELLVKGFLDEAEKQLLQPAMQVLDTAADSLHSAALSSIRRAALRDTSEFGEWARLAETDPEAAHSKISAALGSLPVGDPWSAFAPIYNQDSPDYIQAGVAKFADQIMRRHKVSKQDYVVEAAAGTAAVSRVLTGLGYANIGAFDQSRPMLAEAFRLSAHLPGIKPFEASLGSLRLAQPAKAILWTDYSSNFALRSEDLTTWIANLADNLVADGILIFDVRTTTGWDVDFYRQKVTTFASDNFQRIWINLPDYAEHTITFDVFIRQRHPAGGWSEWKREQMTERMWSLSEVRRVVEHIPGCKLEAIYGDDFRKLGSEDPEPGLAYFVLKRVRQ